MGLTIRLLWSDNEALGVELRASNEKFAATTDLISTTMELRTFAACIAGFPARLGDERPFVSKDGYCGLRFRTIGTAGRAVVDVALEANQLDFSTAKAKAEFSIPVEPAAIDRFVAALHAMAEGRADEAGW